MLEALGEVNQYFLGSRNFLKIVIQRYIPHNEFLKVHFKKDSGFKIYRYFNENTDLDPNTLSQIFDQNII